MDAVGSQDSESDKKFCVHTTRCVQGVFKCDKTVLATRVASNIAADWKVRGQYDTDDNFNVHTTRCAPGVYKVCLSVTPGVYKVYILA